MKKFISAVQKAVTVLYKIVPFIIGMYTYYPYYANDSNSIYPLLDTIYTSLKLYGGSVKDGVPIGALLQIARFLGMAVTLSILMNIISRFNRIKLINPNSTVVYGSSAYADYLYGSLSVACRIRGKDAFIRGAGKYIIMFPTDRENIRFYSDHYKYLQNRKTYIMLEDISRQNIENENVTVFSISENCAREYWRDFPPEKSEKIALIGFGSLGEDLLIYGLQNNIISPDQHFEYHIYGNGKKFRQFHTELDKMAPDSVIFHDDGAYDINELTSFGRVILCGEESANISALSDISAAVSPLPDIYVYAPNGDIVTNLFGSKGIRCFGDVEKSASIDIVMNEKSMEAARAQHEFYAKKYGGADWKSLNTFKRYSNVSSSDYMHVIQRLEGKGVSMEALAELEHIRWCRYHYLNNWKYGKERDDSRKIHNCLIPFSEIDAETRKKDTEAIKSRLSE